MQVYIIYLIELIIISIVFFKSQYKRGTGFGSIPIIYLNSIYTIDIQLSMTIIHFYYHIENLLSVFFFIFLLI